jgi:hypothetical protein
MLIIISDDNVENWDTTPEQCSDVDVSKDDMEDYYGADIEEMEEDEILDIKWKLSRKPKLPEPVFTDIDYTPKFENKLIERYHKTGLQVIVKLASIELTPDKPDFPIGGWHVEGLENERICATALYYLDSENVTSSSLSFRMQTDVDISGDQAWQVGQEQYKWLESVYAVNLSPGGDPAVQNYGSVDTCEGRLLAFPNVL